jgi:hypothetical protein
MGADSEHDKEADTEVEEDPPTNACARLDFLFLFDIVD